MGYNPIPADQWTQDDLDRAEAAGDYAAINTARKAGHLNNLLQPAATEAVDPARLDAILEHQTPVGPTVPGLQPGGPHTASAVTQEQLDRLGAEGNYAEINRLRREGQLAHLGAPATR